MSIPSLFLHRIFHGEYDPVVYCTHWQEVMKYEEHCGRKHYCDKLEKKTFRHEEVIAEENIFPLQFY